MILKFVTKLWKSKYEAFNFIFMDRMVNPFTV